jgi:hypothetical protein
MDSKKIPIGVSNNVWAHRAATAANTAIARARPHMSGMRLQAPPLSVTTRDAYQTARAKLSESTNTLRKTLKNRNATNTNKARAKIAYTIAKGVFNRVSSDLILSNSAELLDQSKSLLANVQRRTGIRPTNKTRRRTQRRKNRN